MALNITFDGYTHFDDDSYGNLNIKYQAYFHHVNGGSSASKWNDVRTVSNLGYYSCNLGDLAWLGQEGNVASGDVVVMVFWSPTTSDRMDSCASLIEWSCFRILLDGSDVYTTQVQIKPNICPNLIWSLQIDGLVNENISTTNGSGDTHQWNFTGINKPTTHIMYQINDWYTNLMTANAVDNTDYDWDDGNQDNNLSGASNSSHSWTSAGDYTVEIVIEDDCGCTVTGTDSIRIKNNPPVPNSVRFPPPLSVSISTFTEEIS